VGIWGSPFQRQNFKGAGGSGFNMSIDKKYLTAFALGEMQGAEYERAKLLVETDSEARSFVEEVKRLSTGRAAASGESTKAERGTQGAEISEGKKQYWVEACIVCTMLLVFFPPSRNTIMSSLQKNLQHSQGLPKGAHEAWMSGPFSGGESNQAVKEPKKLLSSEENSAVFSALSELEKRELQAVEVGRCKVQLPTLMGNDRADPVEGKITHIYETAKAIGGNLGLTVAAFSRKMFIWELGEEFAGGKNYLLVRRSIRDRPAVFYFVPQAAHEPVCGVQASIQGVDLSGKEAGQAISVLEDFAKKIAEAAEIR
jgi:hypothetical protein